MKKPANEIDLLKSRVAKQRNEIGRLTHKVEELMAEKAQLVREVREAERSGARQMLNAVQVAIKHRGWAGTEVFLAGLETALAPGKPAGR